MLINPDKSMERDTQMGIRMSIKVTWARGAGHGARATPD